MKTSVSWQILTIPYISRRICPCPNSLSTLMVDWMPCSSWGTCPYASVSHQQPSIPDGGGMPFSPQAYTIILISPMLLALFFNGAGKWIQGLMHAKQALFLWTLRSTLTWLHFPQSLVSLHALVSATNWAILLWLMTSVCLEKKKNTCPLAKANPCAFHSQHEDYMKANNEIHGVCVYNIWWYQVIQEMTSFGCLISSLLYH